MDRSRSNTDGDASPFPWEPEESAGEGLGATGVFATPAHREPAQHRSAPEPAQAGIEPPPAAAPRPFAEPVVHAVDTDVRGQATSNILERMRQASAVKSTPEEPALPPASMPQSPTVQTGADLGFTQLIRTLRTEAGAPSASLAKPAVPSGSSAERDASFTALFHTLDAEEESQAPAPPTLPAQLREPSFPEPAARPSATASPSAASSGFTELLRTVPAAEASAGFAVPAPPAPPPARPPASSAAGGPGEFTRLFTSFDSSAAKSPVQPTLASAAPAPADKEPGAFTRLMSEQPAAGSPCRQESREFRSSGEGSNLGATTPFTMPGDPSRSPAYHDPFADPASTPSAAMQGAPEGGGGITRLIRMLDEPAAGPDPAASRSFAAAEPLTPPVVARQVAEPPRPAPPASSPSGPSEYTRILDASRMRELALRNAQPQAQPQGVTAGSPAPAPGPAGVPMPQISVQPIPMQAMPHFGQPVPMAFSGGSASVPGASFQASQMPVAAPPLPVPAPAPASAAPGGKFQQYVPLLLVFIVFLLIALFVTVIFLLKK